MDWSDLNARQRDTLKTLAKHDPQTAPEIANTLGLDRSTVTRHLATLRDHGLAEGKQHGNGSGNPISNYLTEEGRGLVRENIVEPAREIQE